MNPLTFLRKWRHAAILLALLCLPGTAWMQDHGSRGYHIIVAPVDTMVTLGDTVFYEAYLENRDGFRTDTTFIWTLEGKQVGTLTENILVTEQAGSARVVASLDRMSGRAHVLVADEGGMDSLRVRGWLEIVPEDTAVIVGTRIQYRAFYMDSFGRAHDTTVTWSVLGKQVGLFSEDGLFDALEKGTGIINARVGRYSATTRVIVYDETGNAFRDSAQVRFRDREGKQVGHIFRLAENDIFKIHGLPFPLNMLNGGMLIFPPGSLEEDIMIDITLPDFAVLRGDSITYVEEILNSVSFHVYVGGVLVSPYYFTEPVDLVLPYKDELMETLGLEPEDLWIYFYSDSTGFLDGGITDIVVDSAENKIYGKIIHFSDLVVVEHNGGSTGIGEVCIQVPKTCSLDLNYPNPFNPETTIHFSIGMESGNVVLAIYNIQGQCVRTLFHGMKSPGRYAVQWDGKDDHARAVCSGIYICRLQAAGVSQSIRMALIR